MVSTALRRAFRRPIRRPDFVLAAHYFSDGWPLDSLQVMRSPVIRRELRQIRKDGFNTIIVVVPWRSFQSSQQPVEYDRFYQSQLRLVLKEAQRAGLAVLLRVAYTHQVRLESSLNGFRWAQAMLTDPAIEAAWLDYFSEISRIGQEFDCCIGGFISWEELWHAFRVWQEQSGDANTAAARSSGYLDYLEERGIHHDGCIPCKDSPEHAHFLDFANLRMETMFERARSRWSQLGVEYRVDKDPVPSDNGIEWLDNNNFLAWEPHRYSYWAPFMGAENVGEELSAEQAEVLLRYMLDTTSEAGAFPGQVLEQFNFIDNTQKYLGTHAKIAEQDLGDFLMRAVPLLRRYAGGYGLWASRDYRMNLLFNGAFLDECRGWVLRGAVNAKSAGGVRLRSGGALLQKIEPRITWVQRNHSARELTLEIDCLPRRFASTSQVRVRLNEGAWASCTMVEKGRLTARVLADLKDVFDNGISFEVENCGRPLTLTRVFLHYETYAAGVRDVDARPAHYLDIIQEFNAQLNHYQQPPADAGEDDDSQAGSD